MGAWGLCNCSLGFATLGLGALFTSAFWTPVSLAGLLAYHAGSYSARKCGANGAWCGPRWSGVLHGLPAGLVVGGVNYYFNASGKDKDRNTTRSEPINDENEIHERIYHEHVHRIDSHKPRETNMCDIGAEAVKACGGIGSIYMASQLVDKGLEKGFKEATGI